MGRRTAVALRSDRAPRWVGTLVGEVLAAYRDAPLDRPRELAGFIMSTTGWERGQSPGLPAACRALAAAEPVVPVAALQAAKRPAGWRTAAAR